MNDLMQDWKATIALVRADFRRRLELEGRPVTIGNAWALLLKPGALSVASFRVNTWLAHKKLHILVKIIEMIIFKFSKIEIEPGALIGPGFVLADFRGTCITKWTRIGKNCTFVGTCSMTLGGLSNVDFDKDEIILGDNCILGGGVRILGAVQLAAETQVKPNAVVLSSFLEPGGILSGIPAQRQDKVLPGTLAGWNPLNMRRAPGFRDFTVQRELCNEQ